MSVILYQSGITEDYKPKEFTFTDEEILGIFNDFEFIETARLYEIPNVWCVWGSNSEIDDEDFNKLASTMINKDIFSPVMFIHDTEINYAWMLTDNIIKNGYNEFKEEFIYFLDEIAENVIKENESFRQQQNQSENLVFLTTVGPTEDKKIMFEFDPNAQSKQFYDNLLFEQFSKKIFDFLKDNYVDGDTFIIFEDKKTIIIVIDENVNDIMSKMIKDFERREQYEDCLKLKTILDLWNNNKMKSEKKKEGKDKK